MSPSPCGFSRRRLAYPVFVTVVLVSWLSVMVANDLWGLLVDWWAMPVTMVFGSFVAGFTATGGSAVAFPVFTKLLEIPSADARMFGLMIQSFGMTAASIYIWSRRIPFLFEPVKWAVLGSVAGMMLSITLLPLPGSSAKLLFTAISSLFALVLIWSHWFSESPACQRISRWGPRQSIQFVVAGLIGGVFSESTGCGTDMMVFALLTLIYGIDEHISIPTSVIVMAITSMFGFATHGLLIQDIGPVWDYWLVCIPVVIVGAPLGAMMLTRISRTQIVVFLCALIALELASTILFVPIDQQALSLVLPMSLGVALLLAVPLMEKRVPMQRTTPRRRFLYAALVQARVRRDPAQRVRGRPDSGSDERFERSTGEQIASPCRAPHFARRLRITAVAAGAPVGTCIDSFFQVLAVTAAKLVGHRIALHICNAYLRLLLAVNRPRLFRLLMLQNWYRSLQDQWIADLDIKASAMVLDAGCGPGLLTHRLSARCRFAVGADLSPAMLTAGKDLSPTPSNIAFVCTDVSNSGLSSQTFDVVLASSLINIVPTPMNLVTELRRVAKPDAVVSMLFPAPAMTRTAVISYSAQHGLSLLASALLATWQSQAPKMDPEELATALSEHGLEGVTRIDYLDGMVSAFSFRPSSTDMENL